MSKENECMRYKFDKNECKQSMELLKATCVNKSYLPCIASGPRRRSPH